jgi:Zn/Cd-binding protein ZinT
MVVPSLLRDPSTAPLAVFTLTSLFHALASEGTSSSNASEKNTSRRVRNEYFCVEFIKSAPLQGKKGKWTAVLSEMANGALAGYFALEVGFRSFPAEEAKAPRGSC